MQARHELGQSNEQRRTLCYGRHGELDENRVQANETQLSEFRIRVPVRTD